MESVVSEYDHSGYIRERSGSILPGIAPSNVYRCEDGDFLIGANQDALFARLCGAMGQSELASDLRYIDPVARGQNQHELDEIIDRWTQTLTVEAVEALMIEHSVPAGRVYRGPEMLNDPHYAARDAIIELDPPRWGKLKMQNAFPKFSGTPSGVRRPAPPEIGQDNAEVFDKWLGWSSDKIAELEAAGAI